MLQTINAINLVPKQIEDSGTIMYWIFTNINMFSLKFPCVATKQDIL